MVGCRKSLIRVPKPLPIIEELARLRFTFDDIKGLYIQAIYHSTQSIKQTAEICAIDRNTVYHYLGRDFYPYHKGKQCFNCQGRGHDIGLDQCFLCRGTGKE